MSSPGRQFSDFIWLSAFASSFLNRMQNGFNFQPQAESYEDRIIENNHGKGAS